VNFAFVDVSGDGEQGGVGGVGVQDKADGLAVGVPLGQGDDAGAVGFGPGLLGEGRPSLARSWSRASSRSGTPSHAGPRNTWSDGTSRHVQHHPATLRNRLKLKQVP
jgi:hypothetical protein